MRPAVDPFDDGIGGLLQLVIKTTRHQAAEDGISGLVAMEGKAGDVGLVAGRRHGPMHPLDDVGAYLEFAKRMFKARLQGEAGRGDPFGKAKSLELSGPAEHQAAELGIPVRRARAQIGNASAFVGDVTQGPVEAGPALALDLLLERGLDLLLAARPEFEVTRSSARALKPRLM